MPFLLTWNPDSLPGHLDLARPQHDLDCGREKNRVGCAHSLTTGVTESLDGLIGGGDALDHHHFHAALRCPLQHHLVHEGANDEDAATARLEHVLRRKRIRNALRVKARSLVANPDGDARGSGIAQRRELDVDMLLLVVAVAMLDGVDHRFANGDADPVQRVLIESGQPSEVIACHLHEVEHFVRAVKLQTDCFPLRHAPRQRNYSGRRFCGSASGSGHAVRGRLNGLN